MQVISWGAAVTLTKKTLKWRKRRSWVLSPALETLKIFLKHGKVHRITASWALEYNSKWRYLGRMVQPQFVEPQFVEPQFVEPQFVDFQFVEPQFIEVLQHRTPVRRTPVCRSPLTSNANYVEPGLRRFRQFVCVFAIFSMIFSTIFSTIFSAAGYFKAICPNQT
jgi:hypothetical protein